MILPESLETLNKRLADFYGKAENGLPNWRVVFSEDQFEQRFGTFDVTSDKGIYLRTETGVLQVPKYSYLKEKYVLEKFIYLTTAEAITELCANYSYEPVWVFAEHGDPNGKALPPIWPAIQFVIRSTLGNKEPLAFTDKDSPEEKEKRIREILDYFDTSETADALFYKQGIVVPSSYQSGN